MQLLQLKSQRERVEKHDEIRHAERAELWEARSDAMEASGRFLRFLRILRENNKGVSHLVISHLVKRTAKPFNCDTVLSICVAVFFSDDVVLSNCDVVLSVFGTWQEMSSQQIGCLEEAGLISLRCALQRCSSKITKRSHPPDSSKRR